MLILSHCVIIVWHHQMELGENSDSPYEMASELINYSIDNIHALYYLSL